MSKAHFSRIFLVLCSSGFYLSISRHVGESGREKSGVWKMLPVRVRAISSVHLPFVFARIALGQ